MLVILAVILGLALCLAGVASCVVPILPGPALCYASLLILSLARGWEPFSVAFLVVTGVLMAAVTLLDTVVVMLGAKRMGASRAGIIGAMIGLVLGMILLPVWGIFPGAFLGAVAGEALMGAPWRNALSAGWGVLLGNLGAMGMKLAYGLFALAAYVVRMF